MAIKLYDLAGAEDDRRFSPYCWRVKMALKHKGLDFETIPWRVLVGEAPRDGLEVEPLVLERHLHAPAVGREAPVVFGAGEVVELDGHVVRYPVEPLDG